ncbi:MAG: PfkB family carbohydrate kinase, partial [Nitrososphaerales archaeon]
TGEIGMDALKKLGVGTTILTGGEKTMMLHNNERLYEISTGTIQTSDTTGLGDIFVAAYTCAFARESDAVWALCIGAAASLTALETNAMGIQKIPARKDVEVRASLLRDSVKVRHL